MDNPLKPKKVKEVDHMKKPKPVFSRGVARTILNISTSQEPDVYWLQTAVEDLCRSRSLPLQLLSNDFMRLLGNLFEAQEALTILTTLRTDYRRSHPFTAATTESDYGFLTSTEIEDVLKL